jgi:hypothetical protein
MRMLWSLAAFFIVSAFQSSKHVAVNGFPIVPNNNNGNLRAPSSSKNSKTTNRSRPLHFLDPTSIGFSAEMFQIPSIGELYGDCLDLYPLPTKSFTAGLLCGLGDYIAQKRDKSMETIDMQRLRRFALKGLGGGVIWALWYDNVDALSESLLLSMMTSSSGEEVNGAAQVFLSMVLEQFLFCPLVFGLWEIPMGALLNGARPESIPGTITSKLGFLLVENAKLWTPANLLVYNIPLEFRVLLSSVVDVLWQSILSEVAAESGAAGAASEPALLPVQQSSSSSNLVDSKRLELAQRVLAQRGTDVVDPGVGMVSNFLETGNSSSKPKASESSTKQRKNKRATSATTAALELNR